MTGQGGQYKVSDLVNPGKITSRFRSDPSNEITIGPNGATENSQGFQPKVAAAPKNFYDPEGVTAKPCDPFGVRLI